MFGSCVLKRFIFYESFIFGRGLTNYNFTELWFQMNWWPKRRNTEKSETDSIWLSSSFMATKLLIKKKKLFAGHGYFKATNALFKIYLAYTNSTA